MAVYYDSNVVVNQMLYGVIGNQVLKWAKGSSLVPFLNHVDTQRLNRLMAMGIAAVSAIGINYTYSYSAEGVLDFHATGLTLAAIYDSARQYVVAYMAQQIPYHLTKPTDATATATAITTKAGVTVTATSAEPPGPKDLQEPKP